MRKHPSFWATILITSLTPVIWGSTFLLSSEVLPQNTPLMTAAIRTLPAGFALILITQCFKPGIPWLKMLLLAFLNIAAFQSLLFVAAQRLPGGIAAVVSSLQPLMTIFLVWWFDSKRPRFLTLAASLCGLAGMGAIFWSPTASYDPLGVIAALTGSVAITVGTFLAVRWRNRMPLLPFIGWKMALGGLILLGPALLFESHFPPLSPTQWAGYAYLSLIGTVLAYVIWFRGLVLLSPVSVTSLGLLSPLTATLLGWAIKNESMDLMQSVCIASVLACVVILQISTSRDAHSSHASSDPKFSSTENTHYENNKHDEKQVLAWRDPMRILVRKSRKRATGE